MAIDTLCTRTFKAIHRKVLLSRLSAALYMHLVLLLEMLTHLLGDPQLTQCHVE